MSAKTVAQRVGKVKQAKRDIGLKEVRSLWAYPEDFPAIRAYAAKLLKRRSKPPA